MSIAIEKYLPAGEVPRARFEELCKAGCDRVGLFLLFYNAVLVGHSLPNKSVYQVFETSRDELKGLPDDIEQIAQRIFLWR